MRRCDGLQLGLHHLHASLRHDLGPEDRDHEDPDDDRQQDDGDTDVAGDAVEEHQADEDGLEDRREDPGQQCQWVGAIGLRRAQVRVFGSSDAAGSGVGVGAQGSPSTDPPGGSE